MADDAVVKEQKKIALRQNNAQSYLLGAFPKLQAAGIRPPKYEETISYGGAPAALVSSLSNPKKVASFIEGTSAQLSGLTPRLEFFWMIHDKKGGPPTEKKFLFSDHVKGQKMIDLATAKRKGGRLVLEGRDTIGTDVGVKEFTWMWDNKHDGDKTLKASVTIHFGSVKELLNKQFLQFIFTQNTVEQTINQKEEESEEGTETTREKMANEIAQRYRIMERKGLAWYKQNKKLKPAEAMGINYTAIKVIVGWAKPNKEPKDKQEEEFLDSVLSTQRTILLGFSKYNLTFGAEGQVTLKIEYIGSLDSLISDPDLADCLSRPGGDEGGNQESVGIPSAPSFEDRIIAWPGQLHGVGPYSEKAFGYSAKTAWQTLSTAVAGTGKRQGAARGLATGGAKANVVMGALSHHLIEGENAGTTVLETDVAGFYFSEDACDYEEATLRMHKQYITLHKEGGEEGEIKALQDGIDVIKQVRSRLQAKTAYGKQSHFLSSLYQTGGLRFVRVDASVVDDESTTAEAAAALGDKVDISSGKAGKVEDDAKKKAAENVKAAIESTAEQQQLSEKADTTKKHANVLDPTKRTAEKADGDSEKGAIYLYYITVGNLLDAAIDHLDMLKKVDSRIILGSFNAGSAGFPGNPDENYPIADIPLSIDWLGQWFVDNFTGTSPPILKISVRQFLNKLLNDLVAPLINKAFDSSRGESKLGFSMTSYTFPKDAGAKELTGRQFRDRGKSTIIKRGERIRLAAANAVTEEGARLSSLKVEDSVSYFCAFATSNDPESLQGNFETDRENGIFHLFIGSDRGLVKSFSFSEKKMPHVRAMHIENNSPGSALILPQDVELTMVGNTFFRNGNIVYINADFSLGHDVATKLGIGGYYMVVKSENLINDSKFETVLTCMYHHRPGRKKHGAKKATKKEK